MTHPYETSAMAAMAAIRRHDVTAQELTSHFLARIEDGNNRIGALRHVLAEQALQAAFDVDARIRAGKVPPLAGLPVVVKENCDTVGASCSAGLPFRADRVPSADSWVTARLRAEGAIVLGISVTDPGCFGVATPEVTHPEDPSLTVGGSSGGSAAALAAGFCLGAIGTDTGGSIRIPSACCGTVGLKPTFDALPMDGIFPLVKSLDHVGPMARSVADVELLWKALSRYDRAPAAPPRQIGFDPAWVEMADAPIREAFERALEKLRSRGHSCVELQLPNPDQVAAMHFQVFLPEAAAYHCAHHENAIDHYPDIAREGFAIARGMSVGAYVDACMQRAAATKIVEDMLQGVDAIVTPTLCVARAERCAKTLTIAGVEHEFTAGLVRLTCLLNHTGHPAVAVPVSGAPDRLASSLQVVGRYHCEESILQIASLLE